MPDSRCLVEVPSAPRHCVERAHAEADFDEETACGNYFDPRLATATGLRVQLMPRR